MTERTANTALPRPKPLTAGGEVDAWCTRCKLDLGHRIVAMVGAAPKRVICQTCNSEHNYRAPKSAETPKSVRAKVAGSKAAAKGTAKGTAKKATSPTLARAAWEAEIRSGKPFRAYSAVNRYKEGDLISHTKFGSGYVLAANPGKISVAFESGPRILVQAAS